MFNIGGAELIVILLIAFVVVGPKDLPKIARALGKFVRYIKAMVEEVKRETGIDELTEEFKAVERDVKQTAQAVDPRSELQKAQLEVNSQVRQIEQGLSFKDFKQNRGGK
ncbi:MAG: twin-arginine translocase subunit TatB [Clostridia bacterium]|nr:twin-arginine translocase subunit TatB [Clostridia bacterium]